MNLLGLFYTNNKIHEGLLRHSLQSIENAANYTNLEGKHSVQLAACTWAPLHGLMGRPENWRHHNSHYRMGGHLNIIMQVLQGLYLNTTYDAVLFLEHDVLYSPHYFGNMADVLDEKPVVVNMDYMGMNREGYVKQVANQTALSQIGMSYEWAIAHFTDRIGPCARQGWCYLEPGYGEPLLNRYGTGPAYANPILPFVGRVPNVHVNMHQSSHNHHFTNHYSTYAAEPFATTHDLWGDVAQYDFWK